MKKLKFIFFILVVSATGYSQNSNPQEAFWKLSSLNGELNFNGSYQEQQIVRNSFNEELQNSHISGGLFINTSSYFWHPNFLIIDVDAGFSPESGQQLYLVSPDRNNFTTLKKLNLRASILRSNSINLNLFSNLNESYNNRENLTNLKTNFKNFGGSLNFRNKYVPVSISYSNGKRESEETETGRNYTTEHRNFEGKAKKSFGLRDWQELIFSQNEYVYETLFFTAKEIENRNTIQTKITSLSMSNRLFFDTKKNYSFNSRIVHENQEGNFNLKRIQTFENLYLKLPQNFTFRTSYNYNNIERDSINSKQHTITTSLNHQLYESLHSSATYEYNTITDTQFEENIKRVGLGVRYVKKIPFDGLLSLAYNFRSNVQGRKSEALSLTIQNEEHTLSDSQILILDYQNINATTVVVKDITETIIYSLNIDYILLERNNLLEIQRIPGGQIANNATILIDYLAIQPLAYNYNAIHNTFNANISLFKNKIAFYFRTSKQDYINPINVEFLTLNYFNQKVYGGRFNLGFISGGIEYDDYKSTLIPYRLTKYFVALQGNIKQKFLYTINGDFRDYTMIVEEGTKQQFYTVFGNLTYNLSPITNLKLEAGYRKQQGEAIDLDLINARFELATRYRQLYLTSGIEFYRNKIFNETINYNQVTLKISRKF